MSCEEIAAEHTSNTKAAIRLSGADEATVRGNVAAGAISTVIFWPAMFAMDLSNAEQIELRAFRDRNKTLERLGAKRDCPTGG